MRAFVAATATQHAYNESFPVPALGDLHRVFADLPSPCEVTLPNDPPGKANTPGQPIVSVICSAVSTHATPQVLIRVSASSVNPADTFTDAARLPKVLACASRPRRYHVERESLALIAAASASVWS